MDFGLFRLWKGENIFLRESLVYPKVSFESRILKCKINKLNKFAELLLLRHS